MSLLVPQEIIKTINPHSGFISISSKYGGKNVRGLFLLHENRVFIANQLYKMLTNERFVRDQVESMQAAQSSSFSLLDRDKSDTSNHTLIGQRRVKQLVQMFRGTQAVIFPRVRVLIEGWPLPYREDSTVKNPVQQLSLINQEFLLTTARSIVQTPDCLVAGYFDTDPDTQKRDAPEWEYGAASYADGTWHPEHLFTQSDRNRENPYWIPDLVPFDTNPPPGDDVSLTRGVKDRATTFHPRMAHYPGPPSKQEHFDQQPTRRAPQPSKQPSKPVHPALQRARQERFIPEYEPDTTDYDDETPPLYPDLESGERLSRKSSDESLHGLLQQETDEQLETTSYPYAGHNSFSDTYHMQDYKYAPGPGPGNRYKYDFYGEGGFSGGGTFPRWQYSMNNREYQRDNSEGLREGGISDRRVQTGHGYDMSRLWSKSTY